MKSRQKPPLQSRLKKLRKLQRRKRKKQAKNSLSPQSLRIQQWQQLLLQSLLLRLLRIKPLI